MLPFFSSDSRGSEPLGWVAHKAANARRPPIPSSASKRCRDGADALLVDAASAKRARLESRPSRHRSLSARAPQGPPAAAAAVGDAEDVCDVIRHQFGLEVLLKHSELRLINQELAKCQVALEQLRRCHLIPYPQSCPTPEQMLDISGGKGPALAGRPGEPTPRWAPPFGVVDGPYARHYAKWLIPDPSFDGARPEWPFRPDPARVRAPAAEGRTTRNSFAEPAMAGKGRSVRGAAGQRLQALSNGYPQTKDKAGPCILKRADGQTVKLVCLDCKRANFSSTQGFINHCRIAHKRDFKSHEEAAVQSGQPVDVASAATAAAEEKPAPPPSNSALVHPLARQDMSEQQAYAALRSRIHESLKLYHAGKLPGIDHIPSASGAPGTPAAPRALTNGFDSAPQTPHLSRLMESRNFTGSLRSLVDEAKAKVYVEEMTPDEESADDLVSPACPVNRARGAGQARTPAVMRVPARTANAPAPTTAPGRPASSKGRLEIPLIAPASGMAMSKSMSRAVLSDEEMDADETNLSPNTMISNNAPSLVSDDGEYDDSDEGSSVSGASDHLDGTSVSDVAEITLDDEHEPRALRRGSGGVAATVKLRKDDAKHVTLVSPVRNSARHRRARRL
ncbi:hypothetical protein CDD83_5094 [Cordyceps sp. RAO-2017]|nr:hypothetical protein CDD83_5094 [Cordyceps sp. RAO-2017]